MRMSFLILTIFFLFISISCATQKTLNEISPPKPKPVEMFLESIIKPMGVLIESDANIDHELFEKLYKAQIEFGKGYETFIDYCGKLKPGDLSSDICAEFIRGMLEGGWKESLDKSSTQGMRFPQLTKAVIFLEKSIEADNPRLSMKLVDYIFSQMEQISDSQTRAVARIHFASDLFQAGFDGMEQKVMVDTDFLLKTLESEDFTMLDPDYLSTIEKASVVDYDTGKKLKDNLFEDPFLRVESEAAMAAGLLLTNYDLGKKHFYQAIDSFDPSLIKPIYAKHPFFDQAFIRLKEDDKKEIFNKFIEVVQAYGRLPILPPAVHGQALVYEPEFPAWYRDLLFGYLTENYEPEERLQRLNAELVKHSTRFPRSKHTEEFIGWEFEWIKQIKDAEKRYMYLGQLCVAPNVIIPERVSKSLPQILKIADGFEKIIPKLGLKDALLAALLVKKPTELKKMLSNEKDFVNQSQNITGLFFLMRGRHYFFPDDDGGLVEFMDDILNKWDAGENVTELNKKAMLIELWAGWDDDKAWDYLTKMDYQEGEYPKYLINVINAVYLYSPGFAKRCHDELIDNYRQGKFTMSNPEMESELVSELARISIPWAEELASVILEKRGNEPPVFSFYSLYRKIFSSAVLWGADKNDIARLSRKLQDKLSEDLSRFETDVETFNN